MTGAYRLSELASVRSATTMTCPACDKANTYVVARLIDRYGDVVLPDLLRLVTADCPERAKLSGRCGIVYAKPLTREEEVEIKGRRGK